MLNQKRSRSITTTPSMGSPGLSNLGGNAISLSRLPTLEAEAFTHLGDVCPKRPGIAMPSLMAGRWHGHGRTSRNQTRLVEHGGAGVAWLHIRLDDRPKYYRYEPYKYH